MQWFCKELLHGRLLHHTAAVHNHHFVSSLSHNTQIMGDEKHCHTQLFSQAVDQVQDLGLDRHIKSGCRLIGDQQLDRVQSAMAIMTRWRIPPDIWWG